MKVSDTPKPCINPVHLYPQSLNLSRTRDPATGPSTPSMSGLSWFGVDVIASFLGSGL